MTRGHEMQAAPDREEKEYSLQQTSRSLLQVLMELEEAEEVAPAGIPMMISVRSVPAMAFYEKVIMQLGARSAVVVFGMSDCCMSHVAKQLLIGLGVAPAMVDLDQLLCGNSFRQEIIMRTLLCCRRPPAVFVGGKLLGGIESLIACHINGFLVPLLKDAGALWL